MATDQEIRDAISQQVIDGIRRVTGDSGSTEMQNLGDSVEAAKFVGSNDAVRSKQAGIRIMAFKPGGAC
jgi:hypothetical protein